MGFFDVLFGSSTINTSSNNKNYSDFEIRRMNEFELRHLLYDNDVDSHTKSMVKARLREMEHGNFDDGEDYDD